MSVRILCTEEGCRWGTEATDQVTGQQALAQHVAAQHGSKVEETRQQEGAHKCVCGQSFHSHEELKNHMTTCPGAPY